MSRELQERADRLMKELQDSLTPLQKEIRSLKDEDDEADHRKLYKATR